MIALRDRGREIKKKVMIRVGVKVTVGRVHPGVAVRTLGVIVTVSTVIVNRVRRVNQGRGQEIRDGIRGGKKRRRRK